MILQIGDKVYNYMLDLEGVILTANYFGSDYKIRWDGGEIEIYPKQNTIRLRQAWLDHKLAADVRLETVKVVNDPLSTRAKALGGFPQVASAISAARSSLEERFQSIEERLGYLEAWRGKVSDACD